MAPSSLAQQMSQLHAVSPLAKKLWRRDIFAIDSVLVAPLVFLTILSAIAFAGLAYLTWKAWNCATGEEDVEAALTIPAERRLSYWIRQNIATRQNSNVVWATQVDEENVDFQFSEPSKSRFSEDSNDSVDFGRCPLDRVILSTPRTRKPRSRTKKKTRTRSFTATWLGRYSVVELLFSPSSSPLGTRVVPCRNLFCTNSETMLTRW